MALPLNVLPYKPPIFTKIINIVYKFILSLEAILMEDLLVPQTYHLALSPHETDMAIVSISNGGALGQLNQMVLEAYGYLDTFEEGQLQLDKGYYWLQEDKKKPVLLVVTVGSGDTSTNLKVNLYNGIAANLQAMEGKRVWLPLMGTGAGRLSLSESLAATNMVLKDLARETAFRKISFRIALPDDRAGRLLLNMVKNRENAVEEAVPGEPPGKQQIENFVENNNEQGFFLAGAMWNREDQTERFLQDNIWETGFDDDDDHQYRPLINNVIPGDFIIIKSTFQAQGISYLRVKALGRVISNPRNGNRLEVVWDIRNMQVDVAHLGYYRNTIIRLGGDDLLKVLQAIGWKRLLAAGLLESNMAAPLPGNKTTIAGLISDTDAGEDHLGINNDVMAFARIMAAKSFQPPLAVALLGKYGAGKSFFMKKLRAQIEVLSDHKPPGIYCGGIAQIHFNAWSYLDANLWASIVTRIFDGLYEYIASYTKSEAEKIAVKQQLSQKLTITREEVDILEKQKRSISEQIKVLEAEKEKLKHDLDKKIREVREHTFMNVIATVDEKFEVRKKIKDALENNPTYIDSEEKLREILPKEFWQNPHAIYTEIRSRYTFLKEFFRKEKIVWHLVWLIAILLLICAVPPAIVALTGYLEHFNFTIPQVVLSALFVARACWNRWRATYQELQPLIASFWRIKEDYEQEEKAARARFERQSAALKLQIDQGNAELVALDHQIQQANTVKADLDFRINNAQATEAFYAFIERRSKSDDYKKHLGLVSIIRNDFEILSQLFDEHNREAMAFRAKFSKPLERIILYIDDLDRCSEERVVEVLGAVNLLMAFPLFIVVVGVDPRWVKNALIRNHQWQFTGSANGRQVVPGIEVIESSNYLEKIFQVPFYLKEATDSSVKEMLEALSRAGGPPGGQPAPAPVNRPEAEDGPLADDDGKLAGPPQNADGNGQGQFYERQQAEDIHEILVLSDHEIKMMQGLSRVIGNNPRAIKRFVNVYRIMKAHRELVYDKQHEEKELLVLMFLLALAIGPYKKLKKRLYRYMHDPVSGGLDLNSFLHPAGGAEREDNDHDLLVELGEKLTNEFADILRQEPMASYRKHIPFIQRFTFEE